MDQITLIVVAAICIGLIAALIVARVVCGPCRTKCATWDASTGAWLLPIMGAGSHGHGHHHGSDGGASHGHGGFDGGGCDGGGGSN